MSPDWEVPSLTVGALYVRRTDRLNGKESSF